VGIESEKVALRFLGNLAVRHVANCFPADSRNWLLLCRVHLPSLVPSEAITRMARLYTLISCGLLFLSASLCAADPVPIDPLLLKPLPEGLVLQARIVDPERLAGHPLMQRIYSLLETSQEWQRTNQETTALIQFTESIGFIDRQLKTVGVEGGIRAIWQRGALVAIGEGGDDPPTGGVFLAKDDAAAKAFTDILQQWAETELGLKYEPVDIDGTPVLAAGNLHVAVVGHRVAWANRAEAMRNVLQHMQAVPAEAIAASDPSLLADVHVSLAAVRKNPDFAKGLEVPASDFGLLTFFGGWTDLLRRHERLSIGLHAGEGESVALRVGFRESATPRPEELKPFFAHQAEKIAPPLHPPGTIQTFSWYRDYAGLWNNRRQLAQGPVVDKVEKGDEDAGKQLAVFGTSFRPSELISQLGPHFRIITTEQEKVPYDTVIVEDVLPAAVFVVDLRDEEKFRTMTAPFINLIGLIQGGEQRVLTVREQYKGAQTTSFVYQETDAEVRKRPRDQYNFRVTGAITRGHFILGTTPGIVRAIIDELDQPRDAHPDPGAFTERQHISFPSLSRQLGRMQSNAVRKIVLSTGWTVEKAEHEYRVALGLLSSLGEANVRLGDDKDGFGIEIVVGE
jgi:hypothetical protein